MMRPKQSALCENRFETFKIQEVQSETVSQLALALISLQKNVPNQKPASRDSLVDSPFNNQSALIGDQYLIQIHFY